MDNKVIERCPYRHFKGKLYYVHAVTEHTETRELYVSYQALYPPYGMYLRELSDFTAEIDANRDGNITHQTRRFELYDGRTDIAGKGSGCCIEPPFHDNFDGANVDKTCMQIRPMTENDRGEVMDMMRTFYNSPAVNTNGSEEIFKKDIDECVGNSPFAEGYTFTAAGDICGYAMLAKSFSTEYGKPCVWIEDLYVKPSYRRHGTGRQFFDYIKDKYSHCILRLEAEDNNETALRLYRKSGFKLVPYTELWKTGE